MKYLIILLLFCGSLSAQVTYTLEKGGNVSCAIYQGGRMVTTLMKGEPKNPGTHTAPFWDGLDYEGNSVLGDVEYRFAVSNVTGGPTGGIVGQHSPVIDNRIWRPLNNKVDVAIDPANLEQFMVNYYAEGRSSVQKSLPQKPNSYFPILSRGTQQASQRIDLFRDTIYIAGEQSFREVNTYVAAFHKDKSYEFSDWVDFGDTLIPSGNTFIPAFDFLTDTVPDIPGNSLIQQDVSGLVVTDNHVWTARMEHNAVHVFRKSEGRVVNRIPIDAPALMDIANGDMWMLTGDTVWRYTIVGDTALTRTASFIGGGDIRALGVSPDESRLAVATILPDWTNAVRIYDATTGAFLSEISNGSYLTDINYFPGKFMFNQPKDSIRFTYVEWETDSTLIVPDWGNCQQLKISDTGEVLEVTGGHIALYDTEQDPNNVERLFLYLREYRRNYNIDARKKSSWELIRNWNTDVTRDSLTGELKRYLTSPVTLSNDRTYALLPDRSINNELRYMLYELDPDTGLRYAGFNGLEWDGENGGSELELQANGNLYTSYRESDTVTLAYYELLGFNNADPIYSALKSWTKFSRTEYDRIITVSTSSGEIVGDSIWTVFFQTKTAGAYSLAAFRRGDNKAVWVAAPGVLKDGNDPTSRYETNGDFTFDQRSNNSGSILRVVADSCGGSGDVVIYGDQGEFLFGRQANIYNAFTHDGLFLYHLGVVAADADKYPNHPLMAGNNLGWVAHAQGCKVIIHGADENYKGGSMIIELDGLFEVRRFSVTTNIQP